VTEKKRGRPATGQTPVRTVRMPDGRWNAVLDIAKRDGKTASDVVNEAVEEHIKKDAKRHGKK
jgi:predicted DNA-binding protein